LEVAAAEQTLGFLASLVTALGLVSLAAWFFCSVVLSLAKTRRELTDEPRYDTLLEENERLRSFWWRPRRKKPALGRCSATPQSSVVRAVCYRTPRSGNSREDCNDLITYH
jgi:hypothetical protein